jgi:hypothetical protein
MRPKGMKYNTRTRTAALLAVLAIAVSACSAASANTDGTQPGSDTPVESPVTTVPSDDGPVVDGVTYRPIDVEGGLVDPGHIVNAGEIIAVDGNRVTLGFWMGVDSCYGIERIDLAETDTKVAIDITVGARAADQMCIEIAEARSVTVELDSPLGGRIVEVGGAPING